MVTARTITKSIDLSCPEVTRPESALDASQFLSPHDDDDYAENKAIATMRSFSLRGINYRRAHEERTPIYHPRVPPLD